jgi:acylphosphatase
MKRTPLVLTPGNSAIIEASPSITFMSNLNQKNYWMKKAILHISGDVQQTGFRAKIVDIAKTLDIKGYVANLPDKRVKIIAEGNETNLEKFIQAVNIKNTLIKVTDLEKEYLTPTGEYEKFYKLVDDGETDERLDNAVDLFKKLITVTENGFSNLGKELGDKIDRVGDKVDQVGDKVDQSRIEITSEIHSLRDDFNTLFDKRLSNIEYELTEIKDKVMVLESSTSYNLTDKRKT